MYVLCVCMRYCVCVCVCTTSVRDSEKIKLRKVRKHIMVTEIEKRETTREGV